MFYRALPTSILVAETTMGLPAGIGLTASASSAATRPAPASQTAASQAASSQYTLETLPTSMTWFYDQINNAKTSIDLGMYELQDTTAEQDLGDAASRGVDVRVVLDEREERENSP